MKTPSILYLWLASFAADNLWRIVLPLTDRATARVSYALAWGALVAALALAARRPRLAAFSIACGVIGAAAILADQFVLYTAIQAPLRLAGIYACLCIAGLAIGRYAFAAAIALTGGHAIAFLSFLIVKMAPIAWPDAGSQLAMRYGPWASTVEGLGCVLVMALALTWASRPGATAR